MNFFQQLEPITRFEEAVELSRYREAPSDWLAVVSDVRGSTKAIHEGRYKDVNLAGAASITAVLNALGRVPIPFVFGGDGATLLIPPAGREAVREALIRTRRLVREAYGLDLRLGMVPVAELTERGARVLVARLELSPGNDLALFQGGGLLVAERLVKEDTAANHYRIPDADDGGQEPPDLDGLTCRWDPLTASRGCILSLLAVAGRVDHAAETYAALMEEIREVVGDLAGSGPMQRHKLHLTWTLAKAAQEAHLGTIHHPSPLRVALVWLRGWLVKLLFASPFPVGAFDPEKYLSEYTTNTDTRKLDDALRMVLDCSLAQADAIALRLEARRRQGEIFYGLHRADSALMTCLVFSPTQNRHVHFIDGGDGGYAMAAKQLKGQMGA